MDETDLPGWKGSWGDMVAAAFGHPFRSRTGKKAANVQTFLSDADFVPTLLERLHPRKSPASASDSAA